MNSTWCNADISYTHAHIALEWSIVTHLTIKRGLTRWKRALLLSFLCLFVDFIPHIKCAVFFYRPRADSWNIRYSLVASDETIIWRVSIVWRFIFFFLSFILRTINVCIWREISITIIFVAHIVWSIFVCRSIAHLWLIEVWVRLVCLWPINRFRNSLLLLLSLFLSHYYSPLFEQLFHLSPLLLLLLLPLSLLLPLCIFSYLCSLLHHVWVLTDRASFPLHLLAFLLQVPCILLQLVSF